MNDITASICLQSFIRHCKSNNIEVKACNSYLFDPSLKTLNSRSVNSDMNELLVAYQTYINLNQGILHNQTWGEIFKPLICILLPLEHFD